MLNCVLFNIGSHFSFGAESKNFVCRAAEGPPVINDDIWVIYIKGEQWASAAAIETIINKYLHFESEDNIFSFFAANICPRICNLGQAG